MKLVSINELLHMKNPAPSERFKLNLLSAQQNAKLLGGHFSTLFAGGTLLMHYHKNRESLIIMISGEILETVNGVEYALKAGDAIFIGAGEKHQMENRTDKEVRYLEFYTPLGTDVVQIN